MKERKRNNKGFTLVELIIVIAVMAVLSVVAVPRYIEYVEDSRRGTDRQAIWEAAHAAQIAYVASEDLQDAEGNPDNAVMVNIDPDGIVGYGSNVSATDNVKLDNEVKIVLPEDSYKYKSKLYRDSNIKITVYENGDIDISSLAAIDDLQKQYNDALEDARLEQEELAEKERLYTGAKTMLNTSMSAVNNAVNLLDGNFSFSNFGTIEEITPEKIRSQKSQVTTKKGETEVQYNNTPSYQFITKGILWAKIEAYEEVLNLYGDLETAYTDYSSKKNDYDTAVENNKQTQKDIKDMKEVLDTKTDSAKELDAHIHEVTGTAKEE